MAPPTRRLARPVQSRRYLALRHGREIVRAHDARVAAEAGESSVPIKERLADGAARVFSAEVPGLAAGTYTITATQTIQVDKDDSTKGGDTPATVQQFEVQGPRFTLPPDAIYSFYPPPGHSITADCLPHVVFNDPELPWERVGSEDSEYQEPKPDDWDRNRTPWLAVFVFTQDELKLSIAEMTRVFEKTSLIAEEGAQSATFAVKVPNGDLLNLKKDNVLAPYTKIDSTTEPTTNVIFVKPGLFNALFSRYDKNGNVQVRNGTKPDTAPAPTISQHRFLAHVRSMNTRGMANADEEDEIVDRDFGMIVSNRTGPLINSLVGVASPLQSQVVAVHLVSLEGIERMRPFPVNSKVDRICLVSLHSWTYECLPPDTFGVADSLIRLGEGSQPLRYKYEVPDPNPNPTETQQRMLSRLDDGYALTKYRAQTGEDTVGFYRGPLSPKSIPPQNWNLLSNSGMDLQILDQMTGIMDITYSSAWQLGRTMAISNRAFTTALTRVRRDILNLAANDSQKQTLGLARMHTIGESRQEVVAGISKAIKDLVGLSQLEETGDAATTKPLWVQSAGQPPELSYDSQGVVHFSDEALKNAAKKIASSTDAPDPKNPPPYDEFNTPYSPDWVLVLRFVLDLYHLVDIPLHYLLPDSAQLPIESLRFFVVDASWIDALVDGALCLGNQGTLSLKDNEEQPVDSVRLAIKSAVNEYFKTVNHKLNYKPPVPRFGFVMRSTIVTQFSDMRVNVDPLQDSNSAPLLLRHDLIGKDMMLGFFSDLPGPRGALKALTFTLPPHQQYFSAGLHVKSTDILMNYKRIYTEQGHDDDKDRSTPIAFRIKWEKKQPPPASRPAVYVWETQENLYDVRLLLVENLAADIQVELVAALNKDANKKGYDEKATSAMMAIQLNAPAYQLVMNVPDIKPVNHYLTYPEPIVPLKMPEIAPWPDKTPVLTESITRTENLGAGWSPSTITPHYQSVLPYEFFLDPEIEAQKARIVASEQRARKKEHSKASPGSKSLSTSMSLSLLSVGDNDDFRSSVDGLPAWTCRVRPANAPQKEKIPVVPGYQDLVFSIIYRGDGNGFQLSRLEIKIPMKGVEDGEWLMSKYTANSVTMVSNLRFNVRATYSVKEKSLMLLIIPRAVAGYVWVDRMKKNVTDVSVVLNGVKVRQVTSPTAVKTPVTPFYKNSDTAPVPCFVRLSPEAQPS